jgi:hypothetical protein
MLGRDWQKANPKPKGGDTRSEEARKTKSPHVGGDGHKHVPPAQAEAAALGGRGHLPQVMIQAGDRFLTFNARPHSARPAALPPRSEAIRARVVCGTRPERPRVLGRAGAAPVVEAVREAARARQRAGGAEGGKLAGRGRPKASGNGAGRLSNHEGDTRAILARMIGVSPRLMDAVLAPRPCRVHTDGMPRQTADRAVTRPRKDVHARREPARPARGAAHPAPAVRMTRARVAEVLGRSISGVRHLEERGALVPTVGPGGVRLFDVEAVEAVKRTTRSVRIRSAPDAVDGEQAAEVFTLLDEHVHPVAIVRQTKIHPDAIEKLHAQHARMRGGHTVAAGDTAPRCTLCDGPAATWWVCCDGCYNEAAKLRAGSGNVANANENGNEAT